MTYVYAFNYSHGLSLPEVAARVGGKAANLGVMTTELGLPVPPGFAISTAACRQYLEKGWPYGLESEIKEHMAEVEELVGKGFGDPANPLLVSVRSGAPISMPGMMDTILNLGLNPSTAAGLRQLRGNDGFADACSKRLAGQYKGIVGETAPDDPWEQLRGAVEAVFRSWNSPRAQAYRAREGISDDLGTAVIVQAMVFGNLGEDSATGVLFTRNPATGEANLYGDVMFNAQGEDVVAGTHQTESISVLDERMPAIAAELRKYSDILERHYADVCDIEFTIEEGRLWMLQTRIGKRSPQAALRIAVEMAEDPEFPLDKASALVRVAKYLDDPPLLPAKRNDDVVVATTGLGASPGVVTGEIATTPEAAVNMAAAGKDVLLVRSETSPDDVHGMAKSVGILTTTGGLASHAAVVARGWGIPAVVGAAGVSIDEDVVTIGKDTYRKGDSLTIDGSSGEVLIGAVSSEAQIVPEVATLLEWAGELGFEIEATAKDEGGGEVAEATRELTERDVIQALMIKGFVVPNDLATALFSTPEEVGGVLDGLVAGGLAEVIGGNALAGMFQLTADGKGLGAEAIAEDRNTWTAESAAKALDDLLPFDHRMKQIMTGWQMREVDGEQTLNDHSDAEHDGKVLADFRSLHEDSSVWLAGLAADLPRLGLYVDRLTRAAELVAGGDTMYLASPRVDSFHSIWFELHEDLILLAGRTREDEVAAGRA